LQYDQKKCRCCDVGRAAVSIISENPGPGAPKNKAWMLFPEMEIEHAIKRNENHAQG
jgi:hypothetical protein